MEEQKKDDQKTGSGKRFNMDLTEEMPRRSTMLWCLAGLYLLYTGYRLCSNVIKGVDGGGIGFFIAGVVFLVIGGGLVFFGVKGYLKSEKLRKAQEAAAMEQAENAPAQEVEAEAVEAETAEEAEEAEPKKKLSISERAALVNRLNEESEE